jgi:methionine--tRNA ligase/methionine--tRNA ligase beta chain
MIAEVYQDHVRAFDTFNIFFDNYYSTNSPENKHYADLIYTRLREKGYIYQKVISQTFCENCQRFLPDRYVKGNCPKCQANDQYGDVCEKCNATYNTDELIKPYCTICKNPPVVKDSNHYFFQLSRFAEQLQSWIHGNANLQPEVKKYLLHWIETGLQDWDISRDGPYFGFHIPGELNKYYYVWLDAPIGYIASSHNYCEKNNRVIEDYWFNPNSRIIHFIGKDIIYFHFLFWPAMLIGAGFKAPDEINVHGHLTINGEKMSKSRGTFITAEEFAQKCEPEYLRYYYAKILSKRMVDVDLDFGDFKNVINAELANNLGNFFNRTLKFVQKNFDSRIGEIETEPTELLQAIDEHVAKIKEDYAALNFGNAVRSIMAIGDLGNKFFQDSAPWELVRKDKEKAHRLLGLMVNILKKLTILMAPITPRLAETMRQQLNLPELHWSDLAIPLSQHTLGEPQAIVAKIEEVPNFAPVVPKRDITFAVASEVADLGYKFRVAQIFDTEVKSRHSELDSLKQQFEKKFPGFEANDPVISAARETYQKLGIDVETPYEYLARLVREQGKLPSINTVVDSYNLVSVSAKLSIGAHDLCKIQGNVSCRYGRESDQYTPLGETLPARVKPNEFVLVDDAGVVLCWLDVKQGTQTSVGQDARHIVIFVQGNKAVAQITVDNAAREICEHIVKFGGGTYKLLGDVTMPADLRVARILTIKDHPSADKLYVLTIDLGDHTRQIVAGMRPHYSQAEMLGRKIVVVCNLEPAEIRGEKSEGMLLAAGKKKTVKLLDPGAAEVGTPVRASGLPVPEFSRLSIGEFGQIRFDVTNKGVFFQNHALTAGNIAISVDMPDGSEVR